MNQSLIFDMQAIANQALADDTAEPGFVDRLLAGMFQLPNLGDDIATELLSRADEYESTQPAFAAELRVAAASAEAELAAA